MVNVTVFSLCLSLCFCGVIVQSHGRDYVVLSQEFGGFTQGSTVIASADWWAEEEEGLSPERCFKKTGICNASFLGIQRKQREGRSVEIAKK